MNRSEGRRAQCDVLVLGGGMSGMVAAISALERGASVTIIEKSSSLGGSMALSNGLIWTFSNKEQLHEEVPQGDEALQDLIVDGLDEGIAWLVGVGAQLEPEQTFQWYGRGRRANPAQLVPALEQRARSMGATIHFNSALESLVLDDQQSVAGAVVSHPEGACEISARCVVLATGGFQGNPELVGRYISHNAHEFYLRSNPFSTGDGLLAALGAGAATSELMHSFYGHALVAPPARFNHLQFQSLSQKYGWLSVALNLKGERFTDETQGTGEEDLNFWIARQPEATAVYIVDAVMAETEWKDNPPARAAIGRARSAGGPVIDADSLEQLCGKLAAWGIPPQRALQTLRAYNEGIAMDDGASLQPPRRKYPMPLAQGPFTAVKVKAGLTYTCGGLKVDLDMGVVRRSRSISSFRHLRADASDVRVEAIRGLFAAGCDVGGASNWGYIGGLSQALVTGRIAGTAAADCARASAGK